MNSQVVPKGGTDLFGTRISAKDKLILQLPHTVLPSFDIECFHNAVREKKQRISLLQVNLRVTMAQSAAAAFRLLRQDPVLVGDHLGRHHPDRETYVPQIVDLHIHVAMESAAAKTTAPDIGSGEVGT